MLNNYQYFLVLARSTSISQAAEELNAETYTWVKLKTLHVGFETIFWFDGSWECDFNLKDFHILDDGMDVDPNWYDLWVSARYEDGTLYVDRLALRRIAPPSDGKKK